MKSFVNADGKFGCNYGAVDIIFGEIVARRGDSDNYSYLSLKWVHENFPESPGYIEVVSAVGAGSKQGNDPSFTFVNDGSHGSCSQNINRALSNIYESLRKEKCVTDPNLQISPNGKEVHGQSFVNILKKAGYDYTLSTKDSSGARNAVVTFYQSSKYYQLMLNLLKAVVADNQKDPSHNYLHQSIAFQKMKGVTQK